MSTQNRSLGAQLFVDDGRPSSSHQENKCNYASSPIQAMDGNYASSPIQAMDGNYASSPIQAMDAASA
jgi:hypothetical protein